MIKDDNNNHNKLMLIKMEIILNRFKITTKYGVKIIFIYFMKNIILIQFNIIENDSGGQKQFKINKKPIKFNNNINNIHLIRLNFKISKKIVLILRIEII